MIILREGGTVFRFLGAKLVEFAGGLALHPIAIPLPGGWVVCRYVASVVHLELLRLLTLEEGFSPSDSSHGMLSLGSKCSKDKVDLVQLTGASLRFAHAIEGLRSSATRLHSIASM